MEVVGVVAGFGVLINASTLIYKSLNRGIGLGKRYVPIYGAVNGVLFPLISNADVWEVVNEVLQSTDDEVVLSFKEAQISQANMIAVTGSIMAQVAITGLALSSLSMSHWVARSFFLTSLLSGCISVYYATNLLRILGRLTTKEKMKDWLRAPAGKVHCEEKNQPSLSAVLILDTTKWLVDMAVVTFVIALSIYIVFVYINKLDTEAGKGDSLKVMISYIAALSICFALYNKAQFFDYYTGQGETTLHQFDFWVDKYGLDQEDKPLSSLFIMLRRVFAALANFQQFSMGQSPRDTPADVELQVAPPLRPNDCRMSPSTQRSVGLKTPSTDQSTPRGSVSDGSLTAILLAAAEAHRKCAEIDELLAQAYARQINIGSP